MAMETCRCIERPLQCTHLYVALYLKNDTDLHKPILCMDFNQDKSVPRTNAAFSCQFRPRGTDGAQYQLGSWIWSWTSEEYWSLSPNSYYVARQPWFMIILFTHSWATDEPTYVGSYLCIEMSASQGFDWVRGSCDTIQPWVHCLVLTPLFPKLYSRW